MNTTMKYAIAATALFLIGAFIAIQVLGRQPLPTTNMAAKSKLFAKPAPKEEPKPVPIAAAAVAPKETPVVPSGVLRFDGGKFGDTFTNSATPEFSMNPDWSVEIEMKGDFVTATLYRMDDPDDTIGVQLFDPLKPQLHAFKTVAAGGRYRINFQGNGIWKATVKQGSGKFD